MRKGGFLPIYFLSAVLVANLAVIDIWIIKSSNNDFTRVLSAATGGSCPSACVDLIRNRTGSEQLVTISASGTTSETGWTAVPGSEITFNKANYSGALKMYFQASLSSDASDRTVYARLYDKTHGIGIQGSEISTKSVTSVLVQSNALNFYSGNLSLQVQIKSLNGNIASILNPRIRVVY